MANKQSISANPLQHLSRRRQGLLLAAIGLMFVTLYAVVPQLSFFGGAKTVLVDTNWFYIAAAVALLGLSLLAAVGVYRALVGPRIRVWPAFIVQAAGSFAGRVVPLGLGSISVSYLYLRNLRLGRASAASLVALNNLIGSVGHLALLIILVTVSPIRLHNIHTPSWTSAVIVAAAVIVGVLAVVVLVAKRRRSKEAQELTGQLRRLRNSPQLLGLALLCSMAITMCMVLILVCSMRAVGVRLSLAEALLVLSAGLLAQSATPTPGGLGGVEAGMTGSLVLFGVSLDAAVATALLYRFVTYWLPLVFGGAALAVAIRRHLVA